MGHKFTMVLNREITDEESEQLTETVSGNVTLGSDTLPTNSSVAVTRMDIDDDVTPSLAESIEAALAAVTSMSDLSVPGLIVEPVVKPKPEVTVDLDGVIEGDLVPETVGATS